MRLSAPDREFLATVADVAFANPFDLARARLIGRLAPGTSVRDRAGDREALARIVSSRFAAFGEATAVRRLGADDRRLLAPALQYATYHRVVPQLDALIQRQASGAPLALPFADETIARLVASGLDDDGAARYFAFFFQLRRAFHFIEASLPGECDSMRRLRESLWNAVFTHDMRTYSAALWNRMEDFSTLLLGQTGAGKGQAAAAIGRSGFIPYVPAQRRFATNFLDGFIPFNLSQYPETLIESKLFGHRKGAFTGAIDHTDGIFARCSAHGALFLDEIGEVTIPVQIKLLQVLQERTFTPLGGHETLRFSGRVIAATNRGLGELRRDGRLREDFFYRLCSDVIELPTLRQRIMESPREIELLVGRLVERITGTDDRALAAQVVERLAASVPATYPWPGNVRELEQAVRRVLLTGRYAVDVAHVALDDEAALVEQLRAGTLTANELVAGYSRLLHRRLGTYTEVAKRTGLDPRTSRKHISGVRSTPPGPGQSARTQR